MIRLQFELVPPGPTFQQVWNQLEIQRMKTKPLFKVIDDCWVIPLQCMRERLRIVKRIVAKEN
jgi:hypothetical protein